MELSITGRFELLELDGGHSGYLLNARSGDCIPCPTVPTGSVPAARPWQAAGPH